MLKKLSRPEPAPPWSFLSAIGAVIAMFAAIVLGSTLASTILDNDSPSAILTGWGIGMILTAGFVVFTRIRRSPTDESALRIGAADVRLPLILAIGIGVGVLLDIITQLIVNDFALTISELLDFSQQNNDVFGWLIAFLFMITLQPIAEGLVLRGILFPALRTTVGVWSGFLMCAGFHAVFHFAAYPPPVTDDNAILVWFGLILPFLTALFSTGVRAYTGNTRASIVAHAGVGAFVIIKLLFFV